MKHFKDLERGENTLIKTSNKMGYMALDVDKYTQDFINNCNSKGTYLEIGCAYGLASLKILKSGGKLIANDIDSKHLQYLKKIVEANYINYKKNLITIKGDFTDNININNNSLDAILAVRIIHFLDGKKTEEGCKNILSWLKPGGKLYIISETPYFKDLNDFIPTYEENKKNKLPWPGMVRNVPKYFKYHNELPNFINFLDIDYMSDTLKKLGFNIDLSANFTHLIVSKKSLYKDKPNFGVVIASKPV